MSFIEPKFKTWQDCVLFGDSREEFVSWPFSASKGRPHSSTHGPSQHLHQYKLFPLNSPSLLLSLIKTLVFAWHLLK